MGARTWCTSSMILYRIERNILVRRQKTRLGINKLFIEKIALMIGEECDINAVK